MEFDFSMSKGSSGGSSSGGDTQQLQLQIDDLKKENAQFKTDIYHIKRMLGLLNYTYPDARGEGTVDADIAAAISEFTSAVGGGRYSEYPTDQEKWEAFAADKGWENSVFPDANADGKLDSSDAAAILAYVAAVGTGRYTNDANGFREFMLDYDGAIFGTGLSGFRVVTKEKYDDLSEKNPDFMYIVPDELKQEVSDEAE